MHNQHSHLPESKEESFYFYDEQIHNLMNNHQQQLLLPFIDHDHTTTTTSTSSTSIIHNNNDVIIDNNCAAVKTKKKKKINKKEEQPRREDIVVPSSSDKTVTIHHEAEADDIHAEEVEADEVVEYPIGYRFCPHDHELIVHYLNNKISNLPLPHNRIQCVNLYRFNPDYLTGKYNPLGEKDWYFFTPRDRKYPNGTRPNRAAGTGYWKATGADHPILFNNVEVGRKKSLVFYQGKPPHGKKTDWIMHEYRLKDPPLLTRRDAKDMKLDDWVLCKIHKKQKQEKSKGEEAEAEAAPLVIGSADKAKVVVDDDRNHGRELKKRRVDENRNYFKINHDNYNYLNDNDSVVELLPLPPTSTSVEEKSSSNFGNCYYYPRYDHPQLSYETGFIGEGGIGIEDFVVFEDEGEFDSESALATYIMNPNNYHPAVYSNDMMMHINNNINVMDTNDMMMHINNNINFIDTKQQQQQEEGGYTTVAAAAVQQQGTLTQQQQGYAADSCTYSVTQHHQS